MSTDLPLHSVDKLYQQFSACTVFLDVKNGILIELVQFVLHFSILVYNKF